MQLHLHCQRATRVEPSSHVLHVAAMFGLGVDEEKLIDIVPPVTLEIPLMVPLGVSPIRRISIRHRYILYVNWSLSVCHVVHNSRECYQNDIPFFILFQ